MFLYSTCKNCHKLSIPRIRGGVSPRPPEPVERQGIPRIRGGVSRCIRRKTAQTQYSPHTRGCFLQSACNAPPKAVFPAYAGVFPFSVEKVCVDQVFPACAGVCPKFPPFWQSQPCFPACAEVCLSKPPIQLASTGLPRICVDDLWNLTEAYCSIVHPRIRGDYSPSLQRTGKSKVHPRMRGEDEFIVPYSRPAIGSPPRSRGIFIDNLESLLAARFTPAFAGNIFHWLLPLHSSGVHPRVRGEYSRIIRLLEAKTKNQLAFYRPVYS